MYDDAFENAFMCAPIGMALVDMADRILRVNDALCRILGQTSADLCAAPFRDLSDPHDRDIDESERAALRAGTRSTYQIEKRFRHKWGHHVWVLLDVCLVLDAEHRPMYFIAQVQDISERKELERRVADLVDHDYLTGLFNGRHFDDALARETKSVARYGGGGAVLLVDLDHFKAVNDTFGHKAGDDLLKVVASTLRGLIRDTDVLARLGGDEFGVILLHVDAERAEKVAENIVAALGRQTAIQADRQIPVTASVGVALFDGPGGLGAVESLAAADLAMYEAKEAGRNRHVLFRAVMNVPPRLSSRLAEAAQIQRALANDRLELHCQPIMDLATHDVSQYELLLRLRTDEGALLAPSAFLYVAERFGTIVAIDSWVVKQAIRLIAAHADLGRSLTLHVNISGKSIGDPRLIVAVDRALAETPIDAKSLVFELTETATIGNIDHAKAFTTQLRSRGCRFALDDFGSGFGSFYYLKHLPFDYFKIDGDFTRGFGANTPDQLVVEAIVGIAKGLGKQTVAEFVTDADMMERLRRSGIDFAQGFHIGAPRPIGEVFPKTGPLHLPTPSPTPPALPATH